MVHGTCLRQHWLQTQVASGGATLFAVVMQVYATVLSAVMHMLVTQLCGLVHLHSLQVVGLRMICLDAYVFPLLFWSVQVNMGYILLGCYTTWLCTEWSYDGGYLAPR